MARMRSDFEQLGTPSAKKYKTVWFNAWKYDDKLDIKNAIIQTILSQICEDPNINAEERKNITKAAFNLFCLRF